MHIQYISVFEIFFFFIPLDSIVFFGGVGGVTRVPSWSPPHPIRVLYRYGAGLLLPCRTQAIRDVSAESVLTSCVAVCVLD